MDIMLYFSTGVDRYFEGLKGLNTLQVIAILMREMGMIFGIRHIIRDFSRIAASTARIYHRDYS
jgi:hypothetical protein